MPRPSTPSLDYIRKLHAPQDALLKGIGEICARLGGPRHISPEEGKTLQLLMALHGTRHIVEVGTGAGYSTVWMARALPDGGHLTTIERDPRQLVMGSHFLDIPEMSGRLTRIEGNAHDALPALPTAAYDLMLIDADLQGYNAYLDQAERLVRPGGLIVATRTLLSDTIGLDLPPADLPQGLLESIRRFNARLADAARYLSILLPSPQGLTVALKRF